MGADRVGSVSMPSSAAHTELEKGGRSYEGPGRPSRECGLWGMQPWGSKFGPDRRNIAYTSELQLLRSLQGRGPSSKQQVFE